MTVLNDIFNYAKRNKFNMILISFITLILIILTFGTIILIGVIIHNKNKNKVPVSSFDIRNRIINDIRDYNNIKNSINNLHAYLNRHFNNFLNDMKQTSKRHLNSIIKKSDIIYKPFYENLYDFYINNERPIINKVPSEKDNISIIIFIFNIIYIYNKFIEFYKLNDLSGKEIDINIKKFYSKSNKYIDSIEQIYEKKGIKFIPYKGLIKSEGISDELFKLHSDKVEDDSDEEEGEVDEGKEVEITIKEKS